MFSSLSSGVRCRTDNILALVVFFRYIYIMVIDLSFGTTAHLWSDLFFIPHLIEKKYIQRNPTH